MSLSVDFSGLPAHDSTVKMRTLFVVTVLAPALLWHGVLLGLPHTHDANDVARYAINCSVSQTSSSAVHLHAISERLEHGGCLACLVAASSAAVVIPREAFHPVVHYLGFSGVGGGPVGAHHETSLPSGRAPPDLL